MACVSKELLSLGNRTSLRREDKIIVTFLPLTTASLFVFRQKVGGGMGKSPQKWKQGCLKIAAPHHHYFLLPVSTTLLLITVDV